MMRSEPMTLCQIFIPSEAAYFVISELGEIGIVQFRDLNKGFTSFQRNFVNDVRRCHEMERKLRYIESEIDKTSLIISLPLDCGKALKPNEITDLEMRISKSEEEIKKLSQNAESLKATAVELSELKYVLEKAEDCFKKRDEIFGFDLSENLQNSITKHFNFVTGVISREKVASFEIMLWRISKGNVYFERRDIEKPVQDFVSGTTHLKTVIIVCFHGKLLLSKINKLCEGFRVSLYSCPISPLERQKMLEHVSRRFDDIQTVIKQTYSYRLSFMMQVAQYLHCWTQMVGKIKAIYHTLNFLNMDVTGKCFIAECWVPVGNIQMVKKALADGSRASGCAVFSFLYVTKTNEKPPTFHRTNKFTCCFQNLIDIYGVASYQEVNPALFFMITFPFLFAVMFGDIGHGAILTIFATYLVLSEAKLGTKKITNEIFSIVFAGRYLILVMGIFSFYTGIIYNDVFSKPINLFGSSWATHTNKTNLVQSTRLELNPNGEYVGTPYPMGIDPVWKSASNRIVFLNSFKMKISIILGVFHMILGLFINVANFIHFRKFSSILLEFLPQLLLLCCLFLWLVIMMFMKWILYGASNADLKYGTSCAPSILIHFINMMLLKSTKSQNGCDPYIFEFQPNLQRILLAISFLSLFVMLLGKPLYLIYWRRTSYDGKPKHNKNVNTSLSLKFEGNCEDKDAATETFLDIVILQIIHTVEYALGTISHSASYLRLWALSLAHSELSVVLWSKLLCLGLKFPGYTGALALFVSFSVWSFFTVTILVVMEGLSAFLHTLRLHWVEFMSKFYTARGYRFTPFSFKEILQHPVEDDEDDDEFELKAIS